MSAGGKLKILHNERELDNIKCVFISFTSTFGKCNCPFRSRSWLRINICLSVLVFLNAAHSAPVRGKLLFYLCLGFRQYSILIMIV